MKSRIQGQGKAIQTTTEEQNEGTSSTKSTGVFLNKGQLEKLLNLLNQQSVLTPNTATNNFAHQSTTFHIQRENPWVLDSGAFDYLMGNSSVFYSYMPCYGNVRVKMADETFTSKFCMFVRKFGPTFCTACSKSSMQPCFN